MRGRLGGDTLIGANQQQAIVLLVDWKTRYIMLEMVERKTAALVADAIAQHLQRIDVPFHMLTLGNGLEFTRHQHVTRTLGDGASFAHSY